MSSLTDLAERGALAELESAWLESLESGPDSDDMTGALRVLRESGAEESEELAESLLSLALDHLETEESPQLDGLVLGAAGLFDSAERLRPLLLDHLRDVHLSYEPLERMIEISGLGRKGSIRKAWSRLQELLRYRRGSYVLHNRFGPGEILRIRRSSATVDFQKASDHDMSLQALLDTTKPLRDGALEVLRWKRPRELDDLLANRPDELLEILLEDSGGEIGENLLTPLLEGTAIKPRTLWNRLRKLAADSTEMMDLGDTIARISGGSLPSVINRTLFASREPLAVRVKKLSALLESDRDNAFPAEEAAKAAVRMASLKTPETGALFEGVWLLSRVSGGIEVELPGVEDGAARALRALEEISSGKCAREYLEALAGKLGSEDALSLLRQLSSRRREWFLAELTASRRQLAKEVLKRLTGDIGEAGMYIWSVRQTLERGLAEELGLEPGAELAANLLEAAEYARATEQRRACRLLVAQLEPALEEHLAQLDTRRLSSLSQKLEKNNAAHESGLLLRVRRELANRRRSSASANRRFWEGEAIFASTASIERRRRQAEKLEKVDIPAAAEAVGEAASHGDLSENAEYEAAIERRDMLLSRLRDYKEELRRARPYPVGDVTSRMVSPGTRVFLRGSDGEIAYEIVGPLDARPEEGRINYLSPLGSALVGGKPGEGVTLPGRQEEQTIERIEVLPEVRGE